MAVFKELTMAFLAAAGLLSIVWLLFGRLFVPTESVGAPMYFVVRGEGAGFGLEHTVHSLIWLRNRKQTGFPLVLVDAGLNEEGRAIAELLVNRWPEIRLCMPEELANYIT